MSLIILVSVKSNLLKALISMLDRKEINFLNPLYFYSFPYERNVQHLKLQHFE